MAAAERVAGINGHNVEIAVESTVLEAVVEHHDMNAEPGGSGGPAHPVAVGDVRNPRQKDRQFGGLVACVSFAGGVAPADHGRPKPGGDQLAADPGHEGSFAGATERQVAHRDDRHGGGLHRQEPAIVEPVSGGRCQRVGHARAARAPRAVAGNGPSSEPLASCRNDSASGRIDMSNHPVGRAHADRMGTIGGAFGMRQRGQAGWRPDRYT